MSKTAEAAKATEELLKGLKGGANSADQLLARFKGGDFILSRKEKEGQWMFAPREEGGHLYIFQKAAELGGLGWELWNYKQNKPIERSKIKIGDVFCLYGTQEEVMAEIRKIGLEDRHIEVIG